MCAMIGVLRIGVLNDWYVEKVNVRNDWCGRIGVLNDWCLE